VKCRLDFGVDARGLDSCRNDNLSIGGKSTDCLHEDGIELVLDLLLGLEFLVLADQIANWSFLGFVDHIDDDKGIEGIDANQRRKIFLSDLEGRVEDQGTLDVVLVFIGEELIVDLREGLAIVKVVFFDD
jgi:hypothetical protein